MEIDIESLNLNTECVKIVPLDNNYVFIGSWNEDFLKQIRTSFTNNVKDAKFMPQYKSGQWDGKIRFFKNDGRLPRGLLKECLEILNKYEIKYELDQALEQELIDVDDFETVIQNELISKQSKPITPWDHQWAAAKLLVAHKRAVIKAATSAGKSYIMGMAIKYLLNKKMAKKVLLVVPRTDLVIQFQRDAVEYGFDAKDIGMFFGQVKDIDQPVIIGTWQSIQNIEEPDFLNSFDCLIIDEIHLATSGNKSSKSKRENLGTQMRQICDKCENAVWRFGCTGTMPTDALDYRTVVSGLGPLVYEVGAAELMEKGHVSKLKIIIPLLSYDKNVVKEKIKQNLLEQGITDQTKPEDIPITAKFIAERDFIENNIPRLKLIAKIVESRIDKDENILILANTIKFGENVCKVIEHLNKGKYNEIYHIHGKVDEYERKRIREVMENNKKIVVVATTSLFSTGISVKNLHGVILGNIGKSKISVLQAIGRSLRQHSSKDCARVYDICDNLRYNMQHAKERMNFYTEEGFDVKFQEITL
jgi:superfamily II DNA or RNA helicase